MGNDGGTIVRRADIVRTREGAGAAGSKKDQGVVGRVKATTCALSRQPLRSPVVSDALGRLYNKDAVVRYLLKRAESGGTERAATTTSSSADERVAGHLRGLKDVTPLKLEPNPALPPAAAPTAATAAADADDEEAPAPFVCPLTMREMNGRHRFVYIVPSGCVMSESGLRAVVSEQQKKRSPSCSSEDDAAGESRGNSDEAKCPVSGTPFSAACLGKREIVAGGDVVVLNPTDAEETEMRRAMELARETEARRRKELKAAAAAAAAVAAKGVEAGDGDEDAAARKALKKEEKKRRRDEAARLLAVEESEARKANKLDGSHGPTALTAAGQLAAQAKSSTLANGGKELSAAMRSIYGLDKKKPEGETWMTRGTFNRFA